MPHTFICVVIPSSLLPLLVPFLFLLLFVTDCAHSEIFSGRRQRQVVMLTKGESWCIMLRFFPTFLCLLNLVSSLSLTMSVSLLPSVALLVGQSDSDGDTIVSPTFAREPSDDTTASVYTDKPVITSKYCHGLSCSN